MKNYSNEQLKEMILNLARPLVHAQGLEIWGLDIGGAKKKYVRLYVDVPWQKNTEAQAQFEASEVEDEEGKLLSADIDQCEAISRQLGLALDVEDCFSDAWVLEVSSPGLERKFFELAQMSGYVGDVVEAVLHTPLEIDAFANRKVFRGRLLGVDKKGFSLELCSIDNEGHIRSDNLPNCNIPWDMTRSVSRVHIFKIPQKPHRAAKKQA